MLPLSDPQLQGRASTLGSFVAEELITRLTRQPCLSVISSLSSQILGERQLGIQAQAAMLGVRYLLRGSCAEFGGRLRIYLELVDARGLDVVWADSAVEELGALLTGEGERLSELVSRLMRALVGAEVLKAESYPLPTLDSFSLLLSAVAKLHRLTLDEFQRAHQMLELLAERHRARPSPGLDGQMACDEDRPGLVARSAAGRAAGGLSHGQRPGPATRPCAEPDPGRLRGRLCAARCGAGAAAL